MTDILFTYHHDPHLRYECRVDLSTRCKSRPNSIYNSGTLWVCFDCMVVYCKTYGGI